MTPTKTKKTRIPEAVRAYNYVCRLLTRRDYTVHEIRTKLVQKKYSEKVVKETIEKFEELGFLDDMKYVGKYVRSRSSVKPRGQYLLGLELRKKGISQELIDTYFLEEPLDEVEAARELVAPKLRRIRKFEPSKQREKLVYLLKSRGFNVETQRKILSLLQSAL